MPIPRIALREKQLQQMALKPSKTHQIYSVSFVENGQQKTGFYKKLDSHYPELLAKISVAISVFKRIFQGQYSAEERLVFNDKDQIIGTLSIAMDGFKPFNVYTDKVPDNLAEKERVIPSAKTLLAANAMETMVARWYGGDDDFHPYNWGMLTDGQTADFDFDMFVYWFTIYMKEPRLFIGNPNERINLTVKDWETFPILKDAKSYHSPSYQAPGQETLPITVPAGAIILPKAYPESERFTQLAGDKEAHEKKFIAALKILITHEPAMMKARLGEYFGGMGLNYTSLDVVSSALREKYEKEFPKLCNQQTNAKPFVDFCMYIEQEHYDKLYKVVVGYMGCEDNGYGCGLPSTCEALYENPRYYLEIVDWIKQQINS